MKTLLLLLLGLGLFAPARAERVIPIIPDGTPAPPFMLPGLDDERVSLRDFCGQARNPRKSKRSITIVSFMATYCVPCRHEIPQLEAYAKTAGDDVKVIFVSIDTVGPEAVAAFRQQMKMEQLVLHDRYRKAMEKYGVKMLPSLFILDKEGNVRYQNLDGLPPGLDLAELLKEKVFAIRSSATPAAAPAPTPQNIGISGKKLTAVNLLLSGRTEESVLRETGLSPEELNQLKIEIQSVMKAHWGLE
ncbi:MAG: TlpA disulfide reductase family protein [Fibrobacterota bacterium]